MIFDLIGLQKAAKKLLQLTKEKGADFETSQEQADYEHKAGEILHAYLQPLRHDRNIENRLCDLKEAMKAMKHAILHGGPGCFDDHWKRALKMFTYLENTIRHSDYWERHTLLQEVDDLKHQMTKCAGTLGAELRKDRKNV